MYGVLFAAMALQPAIASYCRAAASPKRILRTTAAQLLDLAEQYLRRGSPENAMTILELLSQDPNSDIRNEARFRRSKLLEARGSHNQAAILLRRILDENPRAAPVRLALAQLLDRMGDKGAAWREVRAAQATGLPPDVARLVDRYSEALRAARPSGASFEIAIAPDTNINRATRSNTLGTVLGDFDISKDSEARSGTGLSLRGQAYRRLAIDGDVSLLIRASGSADLYKKSAFNDVAVDLAAGPELLLGRNRIDLEIGATRRWFGQKPFLRSGRLGATLARPIGARSQLRLTASATLLDNEMNDLQDGKSFFGQASIERAISPSTGISVALSGQREAARDPGYSTTSWRAGLLAWRDVGRATITAGVEFGRLHADERLQLFPNKRRENYSRVNLGVSWRRLTVAGFAPVTRLVIERNRSTIEFYDYRRTRVEFGIIRAF
jgi:hypothetical protein